MARKAYVLQMGVYTDAYVAGVFNNLESAMKAGGGEWTTWGKHSWSNNLDWEKHAEILEMYLED